jgi:transposase
VNPNRLDRKVHEQAIMDFRQAMVAELANPYLDHGERIRLIREKAYRQWDMPWSSKASVTEATIKHWLEQYRLYGKEGLKPKRRTDSGNSRAVSPDDTQALVELLKKQPELTARSAWNRLRAEGKVAADISSSTLSRLIAAQGLRRDERLRSKALEKNLKFDFFYLLECVQSDARESTRDARPGHTWS